MTASPQPAPVPAPPSRWGAGRIVALVVGLVLLLPGLGLLAGGGVLLWAHSSARTSDGFLMSDADTFSSPGFALTSDRLDLATGADWVPVSSALGTARIEVTGVDPDTDVFVGIGPAADVTAYLDGVQRTVVDDLGADLGTTGQREVDGGAPSGPPGDETFWTEQASGPGMQRLSWEPARGNWVLVVMNADGSAGVDVTGRAGATVPSLSGLAWGLLIVGALVTVAAVLLIVLAARRGGRRPGPPPAYAQPPVWTPPAPGGPADGTSTRPAHTGPDGG